MANATSDLARILRSRLRLRHFVLLEALAQHRSVSRAARALGIAQPTLTRALREIEAICSQPLFARHAKGLTPTAAGCIVLERAPAILRDVDGMAREIELSQAGFLGGLRIGIIPFVSPGLLHAAIEQSLHGGPRTALLIREEATDELRHALQAGELDCAIARFSYRGAPADIEQQVLYHQAPILVAHRATAARLARRSFSWKLVADLDWILPPATTPTRATIDAVFIGAGLPPPVAAVETYSLKTIEYLLASQPGMLTLLPAEIGRDLASHRSIGVLPWKLDWELPPVSMLSRPDHPRRPAIETLAEALRRTASARADARPSARPAAPQPGA